MTNKSKFTSKEILFLKSESKNKDLSISVPEKYFSDLLCTKTVNIESFERRLKEIDIKDNPFFCATLEISSDLEEEELEKAKTVFENTFNSLFDHNRGIFEQISELAFIIAFFDFTDKKKGLQLLKSLQKKLASALNTDILLGISYYPFKNFDPLQTFHNALKAIDHAAFFGKNACIEFDATSLNISGDRLYQIGKSKEAIKEYKKGLELDKKNINLLNSIGVCFGVSNQLDNARTYFEKALKIRPSELMVVYNLGLIHCIDKDFQKAIIYLKNANNIDNNVFEVELLLGKLYFKTDNFEKALLHLDKATNLNSSSNIPFRIKGLIYLKINENSKASLAFNAAIKLNPSDAQSLSGCAQALENQNKNLNVAITFARKSILLEPGNSLFKERLESIQIKKEAYEKERKKLGDPPFSSSKKIKFA